MWSDLLSPYIITIFAAWFGAHIIKYIIGLAKNESRGLVSHLFVSGGMPSSHSATAVALMTVIGLYDGVGSGLFGLAALFAMIVMYDAMKVRRSSGEQGVAISQLIKEGKSDVKLPRVSMGHTPTEVISGAALGSVIGIVVFFATS